MNSYISVLSTDDYLPGVLVINKCLQLTNAKFPFTLLITENISHKTKKILKHYKINVKEIKSLFLKNHKIDKWYFTFSKLNIFSQTQFNKLVYIDLDMIITENIDHLFNKPHFSSVNSGGFIYRDWIDLNSGLIVFEPSKQLFTDLIRIMNDNQYYPGDQNILHKYYKNWANNKDLNLGYQYNMFVSHIPLSIEKLNYTAIDTIDDINKHTKPNNIKVFHYINHKPWKKKINNKYHKLWHQIYNRVLNTKN